MLASPTFSGFGNLSWGLLRAGTTKFKHHAILSGHGFVGKECQQVVALLVCPIFARSSLCLLCSIQIRRLPVFNRIILEQKYFQPFIDIYNTYGGHPKWLYSFLGWFTSQLSPMGAHGAPTLKPTKLWSTALEAQLPSR